MNSRSPIKKRCFRTCGDFAYCCITVDYSSHHSTMDNSYTPTGKRCFYQMSFPYGVPDEDPIHSSCDIAMLLLWVSKYICWKGGLHIYNLTTALMGVKRSYHDNYALLTGMTWVVLSKFEHMFACLKIALPRAPLCPQKPVCPQLSLCSQTSVSKVRNPQTKCILSIWTNGHIKMKSCSWGNLNKVAIR